MIIKANKQIGFIYKDDESIDKILKDGEVVFERGFLRERTTTTLPITFGGVGKDLKDYRIYGNTHQNSTTGKNLLNYIDTIVSSGGGLTNVINDDGSITTTGIPTSNYRSIISQYNIIDLLEDGQTYTISSETLNKFVYIQINAVKIAGGTDYIYNNNARAQTFTVDKSKYNAYNIKIQTSTTSGWGSNSRTITNKYQLEKGETATEFEPYTGGRPSPNPDYPQEIISCGDRTKNLFDLSKVSEYTTASGIQISVVQENVKVKGTNSSSSAVGVYLNSADNYYSLKAGKTYVAKYITGQSASASTYRLDIRPTSSTGTVLAYETGENGLLYTPTEDINIRFYVRIPANGTVDLSGKIIFEESDVLHDYEPYGKYKIPVNVRSNNLISQTIYQTNTILNASGRMTSNDNYFVVKQTNIKPLSKYILSENQNYNVSSVTSVRACAYDENDNFISFLVNNLRTEIKRYSDEFTIPENTDYILISFRNSDTNIELVESIDTNIYLDEPLRKSLNNTYTDYIDFANKKVIRRNSMSVINVDNITLKSNYTNVEYASSPKPSDFIGYNSYSAQPTFCSHATYLFNPSNYDSKNNIGKFITGPERGNWWIGFPKGTGLTEIKSKLDGCEFVYILATPTEESITLPNIPTIDGNNTLNIETEITPSQVYIKYKSNT